MNNGKIWRREMNLPIIIVSLEQCTVIIQYFGKSWTDECSIFSFNLNHPNSIQEIQNKVSEVLDEYLKTNS